MRIEMEKAMEKRIDEVFEFIREFIELPLDGLIYDMIKAIDYSAKALFISKEAEERFTNKITDFCREINKIKPSRSGYSTAKEKII